MDCEWLRNSGRDCFFIRQDSRPSLDRLIAKWQVQLVNHEIVLTNYLVVNLHRLSFITTDRRFAARRTRYENSLWKKPNTLTVKIACLIDGTFDGINMHVKILSLCLRFGASEFAQWLPLATKRVFKSIKAGLYRMSHL